MLLEFRIALRYLNQKKEAGFITLITYISIAGLTIGIAALLLTLGILNGFEQAITEKIQQFQAHIRIEEFHNPILHPDSLQKRIETFSGIVAVAPFIEQAAIIRFGTLEDGVIVRGIEPQLIQRVLNVDAFFKGGSLYFNENADGIPGVFVGIDIAERFEISKGNTIILAGVSDIAGGFGSPKRMVFEVRGFIESGMSEYDNVVVFTSIRDAQSLFRMPDQITGFDVRLQSITLADSMSSFLSKTLGYPHFVRTWSDQNRTLFDWLRVQRLPVLIAFGMITLVGAINLICTLVLIVLEKQKDIGILRAMGATSKTIISVFFIDGIIIYLVSFAAGSFIAMLLKWLQNTYHLLSVSKEVYFINTFPIVLSRTSYIEIGVVVLVLCLGATLYPAWKAAKIAPAEAVRWD